MNNMNQMNQGNFLTGSRGQWSRQSNLDPGQQGTLGQLNQANAGGSFAPAANYYRGLLGNDESDFNAFAAPELRRFNQQTIPGIAEQFAGAGAGGLSSSGFQNASINAGTDLSERLASMRAQLRQQGAQGLLNIGQQGLGQYGENVYTQGQPGFLNNAVNAAGNIAGAYAGGGGLNKLLDSISSFYKPKGP